MQQFHSAGFRRKRRQVIAPQGQETARQILGIVHCTQYRPFAEFDDADAGKRGIVA